MSDDGINLMDWGTFTQMLRNLVGTVGEMREELKEMRKAVGTRCTDCSPGDGVRTLFTKVEKIEDRLRFLEIKVAGIAVVSGMASAVITHVITKI
jgi:hypothetical protein